jgi:hypothetical protein
MGPGANCGNGSDVGNVDAPAHAGVQVGGARCAQTRRHRLRTEGASASRRGSTPLAEDVRPISRMSPSTCWKIRYKRRSDTSAIMHGALTSLVTAGQGTRRRHLEPHRLPCTRYSVSAVLFCLSTTGRASAPRFAHLLNCRGPPGLLAKAPSPEDVEDSGWWRVRQVCPGRGRRRGQLLPQPPAHGPNPRCRGWWRARRGRRRRGDRQAQPTPGPPVCDPGRRRWRWRLQRRARRVSQSVVVFRPSPAP